MMGPSHGVSGLAAGLAVGLLAPSPDLGLICGAVAGLAAYGPDIDHPSSVASRALGPVTGLLCLLVRGLSALVGLPRHRGLSHTVVTAAAVGAGVGAACALWLPFPTAVLFGGSAAAGWSTALAGDWVTKSSLPFLWWPLDADTPGPPPWLRLRTGGWVEKFVVFPLLVAACLVGVGAVLEVWRF